MEKDLNEILDECKDMGAFGIQTQQYKGGWYLACFFDNKGRVEGIFTEGDTREQIFGKLHEILRKKQKCKGTCKGVCKIHEGEFDFCDNNNCICHKK